MKRSINSFLRISLTILTVAIFAAGCSKPSDVIKPPVGGGGDTTPVKKSAQFVGTPVVNPDTLWARTPGTLTFDYLYATNVSTNLGTLAESKKQVNIPAQEVSTSCTITLTGEDGALIPKTTPIPVYDTVLTFACKNGSKWQMEADTLFSAGGYQTSTPDPTKFIFYKTLVGDRRTGLAIAPNGSTSTGYWRNINNGAQFWNGLNTYDNLFISETRWIRQRQYVSGGVSYTYRSYYKVVP